MKNLKKMLVVLDALRQTEALNNMIERFFEAGEDRYIDLNIAFPEDFTMCYSNGPLIHSDKMNCDDIDALVHFSEDDILPSMFEEKGAIVLNPSKSSGYLRAVSSIYGMLGAKKIPLPRTVFTPMIKDSENLFFVMESICKVLDFPVVVLENSFRIQSIPEIAHNSEDVARILMENLGRPCAIQELEDIEKTNRISLYVVGSNVIAGEKCNITNSKQKEIFVPSSKQEEMALNSAMFMKLHFSRVDIRETNGAFLVENITTNFDTDFIYNECGATLEKTIVDHCINLCNSNKRKQKHI